MRRPTLSLEERLIRSELARREQADLIRTVNDNTSELIFMKDAQGNLTYANAATLRLMGRSSLDERPPDPGFCAVAAEQAAISANDERVMKTGQVVEAEVSYTGVDGIERTYLSTKSPLLASAVSRIISPSMRNRGPRASSRFFGSFSISCGVARADC